jgi:hypothetical protein
MRDIEIRDEHGRLHGHVIWHTMYYNLSYEHGDYARYSTGEQYMYFRGQFYHGQDAGYTEYHHQTLKQVEYIII